MPPPPSRFSDPPPVRVLNAGGLSEKTIRSAFVFGLPDHVWRTLRTNSRMFDMNILELSDCARAVMADDAVHIAGAGQLPVGDARPCSAASRSNPEAADRQPPPVCYSCARYIEH